MEKNKEKNSWQKNQKQLNSYARFSSAVIKMGVIIALFTYIGNQIDIKNPNQYHLFTVFFSLTGVFIALYIIIKEVINYSKDEENNQ
jgi:NhaP-type Na+/H+ or K+/H+ antiporter